MVTVLASRSLKLLLCDLGGLPDVDLLERIVVQDSQSLAMGQIPTKFQPNSGSIARPQPIIQSDRNPMVQLFHNDSERKAVQVRHGRRQPLWEGVSLRLALPTVISYSFSKTDFLSEQSFD
jgi:hypothetical protein